MAKRFLAMFLVVCMFLSVLPMQALAAEVDGTVESTEISPEGLETNVTTTTNGNGTPVVTVTVNKVTEGTYTDAAGNKIDLERNETVVTENITAANGSTSEVITEDGTETKEWSGDSLPGVEVPSVEATIQYKTNPDGTLMLDDAGNPIPLRDENGNIILSGSAQGTVESTTGTTPEENPDNYDYTNTTATGNRVVTGTVSGGVIIEVETNLEAPVAPEDYDGKQYTDPYNKNMPQSNGLLANGYPNLVKPGQEQKTEEEGYDLFLSGLTELTDAAAPVFKQIVYKRYTEQDAAEGKIPEGYKIGDAIPDPENEGEYLVDEEKSKLISGSSGKAIETGMDYQPSQLVLTYKDGSYFYAYCADYLVETDQVPGHLYKLENLEDSGHYTEEDAQQLRAIVLNAYWGNAEGEGSLANIQEKLAKYAETNPTITVKDKNGKDVEYNLAKILGDMKEHEALAVTQAAIWAYSINRKESLDGVDKVVVIGAQSAIKCYNSGGGQLSEYKPANDQSNLDLTAAQLEALGFTEEVLAQREAEALESDARMKAMFEWLMNLDGIADTNEDVTTVINENTIQDVTLVVGDKIADGETTVDGETVETDTFNAELSFTLTILPEKDSDDLIVYLCDAEGNVLKDKDGNPVVRRLAGENTEEANYEKITADENGVYTLTNLQLSENVAFDLRLDGIQELTRGAYLYTAEGGRLASQTLVGMAQGTQEITTGVTITFQVDEELNVVAQRVWHSVVDPREEPEQPGDPEDPEEDPEEPPVDPWNPPQNHRLANDEIEIPEEPVPLATPVKTGDSTGLWIAFAMMVAFSMVAINLFDKKRQHESF